MFACWLSLRLLACLFFACLLVILRTCLLEHSKIASQLSLPNLPLKTPSGIFQDCLLVISTFACFFLSSLAWIPNFSAQFCLLLSFVGLPVWLLSNLSIAWLLSTLLN
jgi:hypothetical protein